MGFVLLLFFAVACGARQIEGKVVAVADGDTVTVVDAAKIQHRIRLEGIDAPEKKQPFGQRSKASLSDLVFGQPVTVLTEKKDRYGRNVGRILIGSLDVNLLQIRRGMAWFYRRYAGELSASDRRLYDEAEMAASAARVGLWSHPNPQPPWEFRRAGKK